MNAAAITLRTSHTWRLFVPSEHAFCMAILNVPMSSLVVVAVCASGMVRGANTQRTLAVPHNKQLQRTVIRRRGDGAGAPFHYALAPRVTRQRAAAELRRYAA